MSLKKRHPNLIWASSPTTTKIANAYIRFVFFVFKMVLAAVLGVGIYAGLWLLIQIVSLVH